MSDFTRNPITMHRPDQGPDELDRLLYSFFQAEVPHPWPAWTPPRAEASPPPSFVTRRPWFALRRRLAVAASVGLVLVGYLLLARAFPGNLSGEHKQVKPEIANFPKHPKGDAGKLLSLPIEPNGDGRILPPQTVPVPRGGRAHMWEQHFPGRKVVIQLQDIPTSGAHP
jgi:hypothetical protein